MNEIPSFIKGRGCTGPRVILFSNIYKYFIVIFRGLPYITYAPRPRGWKCCCGRWGGGGGCQGHRLVCNIFNAHYMLNYMLNRRRSLETMYKV